MTRNDLLANALNSATPNDIVYSEQDFRAHSMLDEMRRGYRPVSVLGVPIPDPVQAVYVRGEDAGGRYWYVLDWSRPEREGEAQQALAASEQQARAKVLDILRWAHGREPASK
jgi:hypothetical protein